MTTRLALVCHAATEATRRAAFPADEPILLAPAPSQERVDTALRGPSQACKQTADSLGLPAVEVPELRDCDWGRWRGSAMPDLPAAEVEQWLADPSATPHDGESIVDLLDRVESWLRSRNDAGRVLAVTHPAVIRAAIICAVRGNPQSFWRIDVAPLARAEFTGQGSRWNFRALMPEAGWRAASARHP